MSCTACVSWLIIVQKDNGKRAKCGNNYVEKQVNIGAGVLFHVSPPHFCTLVILNKLSYQITWNAVL